MTDYRLSPGGLYIPPSAAEGVYLPYKETDARFSQDMLRLVDGENTTVGTDTGAGTVWIDAAGGGGPTGGGSGQRDFLTPDPADLDPTYGDHFTSSSLDGKWTRVGYISGDEVHQAGGETWMQIDTPRGAGNYYYQAAPAGDFTVVMKGIISKGSSIMFGPMILDNSGVGVGMTAYNSPDAGLCCPLSAGAVYVSGFVSDSILSHQVVAGGSNVWYRLNKTGTAYMGAISLNGAIWREYTATVSPSFTPTRIGFGMFLNGPPAQIAVDFFDVQ